MRTVIRTITFVVVLVLAGTQGVQAGIDNGRNELYDSNLAFTPVSDTTDCQESYVVEYEYDFVPVLKCQFLHSGIVTYSLPLFADIDGDGETEVVVTLEHLPDGFAVVNPNNCEVEHLVNVQGNVAIKDGGTVLGDVDHDGFVDVFLEVGSKIQRWEYQAETGKMLMIWQTESNVSVADRSHMDIIDLNQDGQPELIPNQGRMVNAVTGYVYPGELPLLHTEAKGLFAYTADADPGQAPEGQGNVELIYGTHLYRYDFINEEWIVVREQSEVDWGHFANVSIADMDLDGDVDAVISHWDETGQAVIWDLQTDELLGGGVFDYPGGYGSRINISNMDEDEYPEMVMTCVYKIFAIDDIVTSGGFNQIIWLDETSDESGHTQITSFDFDGNGTYEIIYRDETRMRIFSGLGTGEPTNGYPSGPLVLLDSGDVELCESYTGMEYPTIGDIDNDNQAEIVATCRGALNIYESGSLPWGNASKVWNTQAFNVTCVNQDGTIPAVMTENYTLYNNFLAQINTNPESDTLVIALPDAIIQLDELEHDCNGAVALSLEICNQGATFLPAKMPVALYWRNPTLEVTELIDTIHVPNRLEEGQCLQLNTDFYMVPEHELSIFAVVNDDGQQELPYLMDAVENGGLFPVTDIRECDYTNNLTDTTFQLGWHVEVSVDHEICEGETLEIDGQSYDAAGTYTYIIQTALGCDSTITLNLELLPLEESFTEVEICEGETYNFNGTEYSTAGEYNFTTTGFNGCDSTAYLTLNILPLAETQIEEIICEGETIQFAGQSLNETGTYEGQFTAANGCDSTVVLDLTVLATYEIETSASICENEIYEFAGHQHSENGIYSYTIPSSNGCDSTVILNLTVFPEKETQSTVSLCAGETYEFAGQSLTEAGTYTETLQTSNGCDSVSILQIYVLEHSITQVQASICAGEDYAWNGQIYATAGFYEHRLTAANGCDSIINLELEVLQHSSYSFETTICEGENYTYNGQVMDQADIYEFSLTAVNGCDSLVTIDLKITPTLNESVAYEICEGESVEVGAETYHTAGTYTQELTSVSGCDSILTVEVAVLEPTSSTMEIAICEGEEYNFNGEVFGEEGTYEANLTGVNGCDSTVTLTLNILEHVTTTLNAEICAGETYAFGNQELTEAGSFEQTLTGTNGCDSTVVLALEILPTLSGNETATICEGETFNWGNQNINSEGIYEQTLTASNGCDSLVTLTLNVLESSVSEQVAAICDGETFELAGEEFNESGDYSIVLPNAVGCDSTILLALTVLQPTTAEFEADVCEGASYELNGETFTQAGQYIQKITGSNGCDSIIHFTLNTLPDLFRDMEETICRGDTMVFGGQYLTEPGNYSQLFLSSQGCDSTVLLKLNVIEPVWGETVVEICEGESYEWNGQVYSEKGIYQDTLNAFNTCDSIVRLALDVHPVAETQLLEKICEGGSYEVGGQVFEESGNYEIPLQTIYGCDSTVYLELVVLETIQEEIAVNICDGENYEFAGLTYEQAGTYTASFTSVQGCDSIVRLNLNVFPDFELVEQVQICEGESVMIGNEEVSNAGTYVMDFQTALGCDSTITYQVEVLPSVELFGADASICEGESVELEVFGSEDVNWFPTTGLDCTNCPNPMASPDQTTTYTIQTEGCGGALIETEVTVEVLEQPTINAGTGSTITPGQSVNLEATGEWGDGNVQWDGPEGMICQDCPTVSVTPSETSIYQASVSNEYGCLASDTVHIQLRLDCIEGDFFIPNAFSPNGDGVNEEFHITAYTSANLEYLRIYDRWGELMFETNDFNQRWDGTFRGKKLNPGVYVYYMRVKCPDSESYERFGNVTLIR